MPDSRAKYQFHVCPECGEQKLLWDPQCQLYLCHNNQCATSMSELPREEIPALTNEEQAVKIEALTKAHAQMRVKRNVAVKKLREERERHEKAKSEIARLNRLISWRASRGVANA